MNKMLLVVMAVIIASLFVTESFGGSVRGYYRSNGIYVQPYCRTSPNWTVSDNYSYKGNYNPYTGKTGTNYYRNSPSSESSPL